MNMKTKLYGGLYSFTVGTFRWIWNHSSIVENVVSHNLTKIKPSIKKGITNIPLAVPNEPFLTEYVIDEHVTPKTKAAKLHWKNMPLNDKMSCTSLSLLKSGGYRKHWDLRIKGQDGKYVSFAISKAKLPESGEKIGLIQSTAGHGYHGSNPSVIENGYGSGISKSTYGKCLIWKSSKGSMHIQFDNVSRTFVLIPDKNWDKAILLGKKETEVLCQDRPWDFIDISGDKNKLEQFLKDDDYFITRKYDGANHRIRITRDSDGKPRINVVSRRQKVRNGNPAFNSDGTPAGIDNTDRLLHIKFMDIDPKYYKNGETNLVVEIYSDSTGHGQWDHPLNYITSCLNSNPVYAFEIQQKYGLAQVKVLDIETLNGQSMKNKSFLSKRILIEELHKDHPIFKVPKGAMNEAGKRNLFDKEMKAPYSGGVVFYHKTDPNAKLVKYKFKQTYDLKIVGITAVNPVTDDSKWVSKEGEILGAGCFILENGQNVKITTDELKRDAWNHPFNYIGRQAIVEGQGKFSTTGAVRAPILRGVHTDK